MKVITYHHVLLTLKKNEDLFSYRICCFIASAHD